MYRGNSSKRWMEEFLHTEWCLDGGGKISLFLAKQNVSGLALHQWKCQPHPQGLLAFQYGGGRREDPGTQWTKMIADWCFSYMGSDWFTYSKTKDGAFFKVPETYEKGGRNSCLIIWKADCAVRSSTKESREDLMIVHRLFTLRHQCSTCV